jgi:hypothetical protein
MKASGQIQASADLIQWRNMENRRRKKILLKSDCQKLKLLEKIITHLMRPLLKGNI